jgi:hypothetical protein
MGKRRSAKKAARLSQMRNHGVPRHDEIQNEFFWQPTLSRELSQARLS